MKHTSAKLDSLTGLPRPADSHSEWSYSEPVPFATSLLRSGLNPMADIQLTLQIVITWLTTDSRRVHVDIPKDNGRLI